MSDGEGTTQASGTTRSLPREASAVAERFAGRPARELSKLGTGHIHETLLARYDDAPALVLQRLNAFVFPDLEAVARNVTATTEHLRARLRAEGTTEPSELERRVLHFVSTPDGDALVADAVGERWRAALFIEGTRSYDVVTSNATAERAAHAFGRFAAQLSTLPAEGLTETIPGFHDTAARLAGLEAARSADAEGRAAGVGAECDRVAELGARLLAALAAEGVGATPLRPVHNDCKINNLLFDATSDEALCVIDLDTVMPGRLIYDFGGLVRTVSCDAAEDEEDLARMQPDAERFGALARGYVSGLGRLATQGECALLPLGGPLMALEDAARFFTDHLEGDRYFAIERPGHNRARGLAQLALAENLWRRRQELARAVPGPMPLR